MSSKLISCFLILIITSSFAGCAEDKIPPTPVRPVRAIMLGDTLAAEGRSFPGRAKATEEVNLSFRVNGELTSLPINVGDIVKKGDVLASLDKKDYEAALERAQAESMLAKAELDAMRIARPEEIRRIEAELREAQAVLDLTAAELVRNEELFKKTVLSKSEIDRSRAARDRSAALRDQAKESLTIAKKGARKEDIDAKEAEIKALESEVTVARNNLEYTNLVAPFSGSIVAKYVENYQNVAAKRVICRLLDTTKIEMIVNIPESKISQISNVTDIACTFDAFPGRKVPAKVKEVGTEAS